MNETVAPDQRMNRIVTTVRSLLSRRLEIVRIPTIQLSSADLTFGLDPNWKTADAKAHNSNGETNDRHS